MNQDQAATTSRVYRKLAFAEECKRIMYDDYAIMIPLHEIERIVDNHRHLNDLWETFAIAGTPSFTLSPVIKNAVSQYYTKLDWPRDSDKKEYLDLFNKTFFARMKKLGYKND